MLEVLVATVLSALCIVFLFTANNLQHFRTWLQMHRPVWIHEEVVFGCVQCTGFWLLIIPSIVLGVISHNYWYALLPITGSMLAQLLWQK